MRACPSCRLEWPDELESCPDCLASLVVDLDATIVCPECGHVCPTRMQSCTSCLALLRPGEVDLTEDVARMVAHGMRMHRPSGREPFEAGPACTLLRLRPRGPMVLCGADGLVEANLAGPGILARPPLRCTTDGALLFRVVPYEAADHALVAIGADGAALGTYLRSGGLLSAEIDIRDETSAPVARLERGELDGRFRVVETGSNDTIAMVDQVDVEGDSWIDDQWSLTPTDEAPPLDGLALVALVVAAKVLLGRAEPVPVRERADDEDEHDREPLHGSILEDFLE